MDKNLEGALNKLDDGIKDIIARNPGMQKPHINSGLRATRYFIEFPITGRNIDAFSILTKTQQLIKSKEQECGTKIYGTDSFVQDENIAYSVDYAVNSPTALGAKSKGTLYLRGVKDESGFDSFKFILEKNFDFHDLDVDLILTAYEEAFKPRANQIQ